MIAVDTNILVYAHRREVREHEAAAKALARLAGSRRRWAIPWPCVYEFISVTTNRRIWRDDASTSLQAWAQVEAWLASPSLTMLAETSEFLPILAELVTRSRVVGPVVHDARIAALCLAHGVESLFTRDRDFALFPELSIEDPLRG